MKSIGRRLVHGLLPVLTLAVVHCGANPAHSFQNLALEPQAPSSAIAGSAPVSSDTVTTSGRVTAAAAQGSTFKAWVRFPAEEEDQPKPPNQNQWPEMANATAYNRDLFFGGEIIVTGAQYGDTWHAEGRSPDGAAVTWDPITYVQDFNGLKDCFIGFTFQVFAVCGSDSITMRFFAISHPNDQCRESGDWSMSFFHNAASFHSGGFLVLPQIPPVAAARIPLTQLGNHDQLGDFCLERGPLFPSTSVRCGTKNATGVATTIERGGCLMVSAAMILNYHGCPTTVSGFNDWLTSNNGYDDSGQLRRDWVGKYAKQVCDEEVSFNGRGAKDGLANAVCSFGPQMRIHQIGLDPRVGHAVVAIGTSLVHDPGSVVPVTDSVLFYEEYRSSAVMIPGLRVLLHSPVEAVLTGPDGKRVGYNPLTNESYNEIPHASYHDQVLGSPLDESIIADSKVLDVRNALDGEYRVQVIGTATGEYGIEFEAGDESADAFARSIRDVPTAPGVIHEYRLGFSRAAAAQLRSEGVFDGSGQRPADVNRILTYGNIAARDTSLSAGTTSFSLMVIYGTDLVPATFHAKLNGADVSDTFHPVAGGAEVVSLPLVKGRNVVLLSADGRIGKRLATDSDRLTFSVP